MTVRITSKWKGLEEMRRQLKLSAEETLKAVEKELFREGEETMTDAKDVTPKDTGQLVNSGHVQLPKRPTPTSVRVDLGFGGPAGSGNHGGKTNDESVGYALRVHEDLETFGSEFGGGSRNTGRGAVRKGRPRTFVGHAKFLERPVVRRRRTMSKRLSKRMRRRLKGRVGRR